MPNAPATRVAFKDTFLKQTNRFFLKNAFFIVFVEEARCLLKRFFFEYKNTYLNNKIPYFQQGRIPPGPFPENRTNSTRSDLRDCAIPHIWPKADCYACRIIGNYDLYLYEPWQSNNCLLPHEKKTNRLKPKSEPPATAINHGDFTQQFSQSPYRINHLMFRSQMGSKAIHHNGQFILGNQNFLWIPDEKIVDP